MTLLFAVGWDREENWSNIIVLNKADNREPMITPILAWLTRLGSSNDNEPINRLNVNPIPHKTLIL